MVTLLVTMVLLIRNKAKRRRIKPWRIMVHHRHTQNRLNTKKNTNGAKSLNSGGCKKPNDSYGTDRNDAASAHTIE